MSDQTNEQATEADSEEKRQHLTEHLVELRVRLIRVVWIILLGTIVCWYFSEDLFQVIRAPIAPYLSASGLVYTAPMDKFMAFIKIAFLGGVILTAPIWLFQVWGFIAPGLYNKEKKYAVGFVFSGCFLMILGTLFSYFIVFPMAFKFLMTFGGETDKPMITIDHYLSFVTTTTLGFGMAFELPLVLVILGMMGIVSQQFLREKRRYAIVALAALSAVITPPDLLSMLLMLVPMTLLYEISILLVGFFEKKRKQQEENMGIE